MPVALGSASTSGLPGADTVSGIDRKRIVTVAAALVALLAAGFGGWKAGRADLDRIPTLEDRIRTLTATASTAAADRDRLKADRDRLEALLAGIDATPAACPNATSSTIDVDLWVNYIVDYPCGWSVLEQPVQVPPEGSSRFGLAVDHLFFSPLPISLQPSERPPAEITLDAWYDEPTVEGELPAFDAWLAEARGRFTTVMERSVTTRAGMAVVKLDGEINTFDQPLPALLYLWEDTDSEGVRRIYEAFALEPSRSVKKVIEAIVRSFRIPGG